MRWASGLSMEPDLAAATFEASAALRDCDSSEAALAPQLLFAFVSHHHDQRYAELPELLAAEFPGAVILGCSAQSVLAGAFEIEEQAGLALLGAELPDVELFPFEIGVDARGWPDVDELAGIVLLADPFTTDGETLVESVDRRYPDCVKVGGVASGDKCLAPMLSFPEAKCIGRA